MGNTADFFGWSAQRHDFRLRPLHDVGGGMLLRYTLHSVDTRKGELASQGNCLADAVSDRFSVVVMIRSLTCQYRQTNLV